MPVHVDQMTSDVSVETPTQTTTAAPAPEWQELSRAREVQAEASRNVRRLAAEGFDD